MSDRLLSCRLKELEETGLVRREVQRAGNRVRVSYELTQKGHSLEPVMGGLRDWARNWHRA
jgi:DNA-binding HxlR family transcriptional regulator